MNEINNIISNKKEDQHNKNLYLYLFNRQHYAHHCSEIFPYYAICFEKAKAQRDKGQIPISTNLIY